MRTTIYDPPLGLGNAGFAPMPEAADCPSLSPPTEDTGVRFFCTLNAGHEGDHLAHVEDDEVWASWPAEGVSGA